MENTTTELDALLEDLRRKIEARNAVDFLEDVVDHFDGFFGSFLTQKQMAADHDAHCEHCKDPLDQDVLD